MVYIRLRNISDESFLTLIDRLVDVLEGITCISNTSCSRSILKSMGRVLSNPKSNKHINASQPGAGLKEKQKYQEMLLLDSATNMDSPNARNVA
ncbi:hypothetical protein LguiA_015094 [Lonicera macranthoides]